jgi:4-amino-4-deoxy-L-arabinose transferase-like glycosyltransferase
MDAAPVRGWQRWLPLLPIVALAAVLRVLALATVGDVAVPHGDEGYYLKQAAAIASGLGHPGAWRPPGYPAFLAGIQIASGDADLWTMRLVQIVIGLIAVAVVYDLLVERFGRRAASLSALALAVNPDAVHFCHFFWAEGLLSTLLLIVVWCLLRARTHGGSAFVVFAGIAAAAAALTREMALYVTPLYAAWLAAGDGWRWRRAALYAGVVALCIVPWTIRNDDLLGSPVLIATNGWFPMADGNLVTGARPHKKIRELRRAYERNPDELARERAARAVTLESIAAQQPWWIFEKLAVNPYLLFAPMRSQLARFHTGGWLDERADAVARWLLPLEAGVYLLTLGIGLVGLWLVPDADLKKLALALVAVFVAIYVVGNAASRFRAPLMPFLLLWVGPVLSGFARRERWRIAGMAVTLGWLGAVTFVDVALQPRIPVSYARAARDPRHLASATSDSAGRSALLQPPPSAATSRTLDAMRRPSTSTALRSLPSAIACVVTTSM